jgi:hypothetical protein
MAPSAVSDPKLNAPWGLAAAPAIRSIHRPRLALPLAVRARVQRSWLGNRTQLSTNRASRDCRIVQR